MDRELVPVNEAASSRLRHELPIDEEPAAGEDRLEVPVPPPQLVEQRPQCDAPRGNGPRERPDTYCLPGCREQADLHASDPAGVPRTLLRGFRGRRPVGGARATDGKAV